MFELKIPTDVKLAKFTPRVEKHGKDEVSAATLRLMLQREAAQLDDVAPGLRDMLFKAVEGQEQLPGMPPSTPLMRCNAAQTLQLKVSAEGWTIKIDRGIDESDPMVISGCKVDAVVVDNIGDEAAIVSFNVGSNDISEEEAGWLFGHQRRMLRVQLLAPEAKPEAIDGSTEAFKKDYPEAGDMFAAEHGGKGPEDEGGEEDGSGNPDGAPGAGSSDDQMGRDWPLPENGSELSDMERSAQRRAAEAAAERGEAPAAVAAKSRRGRKTDAVGEVH